MEVIMQNLTLQHEGQKIKAWLDRHDIKYIGFAKRMGFGPSWASNIFSGLSQLTEENRNKLKEVYPALYGELFPES